MLFYLVLHVFPFWEIHLPESGISWKSTVKTPDVRSSENSRKIQEILFSEISHGVKRAHGGETAGAGATPGRGSRWGRGWDPPLVPVGPFRLPFGVLLSFDLKMLGAPSKKYFAASARLKPDKEKKSSGREKSAGEIPSRRGKSPPSSSSSRRASSGSSSTSSPPPAPSSPSSSTSFRCSTSRCNLSSSLGLLFGC